jgi:hypothetical protein
MNGTRNGHKRKTPLPFGSGSSHITRCSSNGSSEIRTHGTLSRTHTFQACALNHSATDPTCGLDQRPPPQHHARRAAQSSDSARLLHCSERPQADRVRFELTIPLRVRRFSRPVLSTTQPPVRNSRVIYLDGGGVSTKLAVRRAAKNSRRIAPHSASRSPPRTSGR